MIMVIMMLGVGSADDGGDGGMSAIFVWRKCGLTTLSSTQFNIHLT